MRIKWFSLVRVTGLLLVLLYHFFQKAFPGGFIGVDIFFTFSGFLKNGFPSESAHALRRPGSCRQKQRPVGEEAVHGKKSMMHKMWGDRYNQFAGLRNLYP